MARNQTNQERIDSATVKIENPNVVGSGFIQFPPQKPFGHKIEYQPPTLAQYSFPDQYGRPQQQQPQQQQRQNGGHRAGQDGYQQHNSQGYQQQYRPNNARQQQNHSQPPPYQHPRTHNQGGAAQPSQARPSPQPHSHATAAAQNSLRNHPHQSPQPARTPHNLSHNPPGLHEHVDSHASLLPPVVSGALVPVGVQQHAHAPRVVAQTIKAQEAVDSLAGLSLNHGHAQTHPRASHAAASPALAPGLPPGLAAAAAQPPAASAKPFEAPGGFIGDERGGKLSKSQAKRLRKKVREGKNDKD